MGGKPDEAIAVAVAIVPSIKSTGSFIRSASYFSASLTGTASAILRSRLGLFLRSRFLRNQSTVLQLLVLRPAPHSREWRLCQQALRNTKAVRQRPRCLLIVDLIEIGFVFSGLPVKPLFQ
jgi:hypothetical protein